MRIMYVEDNPANISLLQRIARMGGHEVINYTDGEVALTRFAADNPDLVLMDLQLEGRIGGLEVVRQLRAGGFKTPIVAVTAYAMVGDRERCIEAGCDGYLSKPLPVAEVVELVQKYEVIVKSKPAAEPVAAPPTETAAPTPIVVAATPVIETPPAAPEPVKTTSTPEPQAPTS
ncbi:MAG: response regulator [Chloroflexi bacterium]|uniref:response regulator n=1 Tax=Candidatus Flexifilum breve TaxID=3140694 RepID=UPI00313682E9|nr:response regulator [Chloroflexota bacterium]